jgi:hypothetical protein
MNGNSRARLDARLLENIARARRKPEKYVREQISKSAARLGITSEAAQIVMAREFGLGTAQALRKLPPHAQDQVHRVPNALAGPRSVAQKPEVSRGKAVKTLPEIAAIEMLRDQELKSRCADLLKARRHFDRVFREATTVLDDRIKKKSGIKRMNPVALVGKALNPDPQKSVLVVSDEAAEQEGVHSICKGLMLAFRDKTHHELNDKLTRNDAIKFCGFVDTVLAIMDGARVRTPDTTLPTGSGS